MQPRRCGYGSKVVGSKLEPSEEGKLMAGITGLLSTTLPSDMCG